MKELDKKCTALVPKWDEKEEAKLAKAVLDAPSDGLALGYGNSSSRPAPPHPVVLRPVA